MLKSEVANALTNSVGLPGDIQAEQFLGCSHHSGRISSDWFTSYRVVSEVFPWWLRESCQFISSKLNWEALQWEV